MEEDVRHEEEIERWIRDDIARKNPKTGISVCPYAAKTVETKAFHILRGKSDLVAQIGHCCDLIGVLGLDIVIIYIQYKITEKQLRRLCRQAHKNNSHYAIMYDHPENTGLHRGVSFSYQKTPLVMIQDLNTLKDAQSKLQRTAYYRTWGLDDCDDMFY